MKSQDITQVFVTPFIDMRKFDNVYEVKNCLSKEIVKLMLKHRERWTVKDVKQFFLGGRTAYAEVTMIAKRI